MSKIGFHASHERLKPSYLLQCVKLADQAGFTDAMCSDHFHPWSHNQGQSGYAWSWLGAALESTKLCIGTISAPGQRYHPAVLAQSAATLSEMYPNRFWLAVGSGQALNEAITGQKWPTKAERNERLKESADVIRALWRGETVTHSGHIRIEEAHLYTRPKDSPLLLGAALTETTARWLGSWADGLLTGSAPPDQQKKIVEAFRSGGGEGKPMFMQTSHLVSEKKVGAEIAHGQWKTNVLGDVLQAELRSPSQFDAAAQFVQPEDMETYVHISPDPEEHIAWLKENLELGFDKIFVHHVGCDQEKFIDYFGNNVLPSLASM